MGAHWQAMLLRHVDDSDVYRIFRWRNDAESRRFSGSDKATKWQAHCAWFASTLPNPFWFIGLADVGDRETANGIAVGQAAALVPVGVARFDRTVDGHAISVTVDPLLHGRGFGSGLIAANPDPDALHLTCETRMADWPGAGYGPLLLECSHEIDLLAWWLGRMPALDDVAMQPDRVKLTFDGGHTVTVVDGMESRRAISVFRHGITVDLEPGLGAPLRSSYRRELAAFLDCAASGLTRTLCTLADGIAVLRVCDQATAWSEARS